MADCGKRVCIIYKGDNNKHSEVEDFLKTHKMQECDRLRLKALKLPCGKRPQCWSDPICEKCKGQKKPDKLYLFSGHLPGQIHDEIESEL